MKSEPRSENKLEIESKTTVNCPQSLFCEWNANKNDVDMWCGHNKQELAACCWLPNGTDSPASHTGMILELVMEEEEKYNCYFLLQWNVTEKVRDGFAVVGSPDGLG